MANEKSLQIPYLYRWQIIHRPRTQRQWEQHLVSVEARPFQEGNHNRPERMPDELLGKPVKFGAPRCVMPQDIEDVSETEHRRYL